MTRSFVVLVRASGSVPLLGGVRHAWSSRFGSLEMAENFLEAALEGNQLTGRVVEGEVHPSPCPPEVFVHCGKDAGVLNGACPGCGKKLNLADAANHKIAIPSR